VSAPYGFTEFGETLLGKKFYRKQKELLDACRLGGYVVARFNNGGGKTREVLTTIVLGSLTMMRAQVYSTSGSFRQIKDQLNPALHGFRNRFPAYEFLENRIVTRDPNSFYHGFATNEAGRFEGQHGSKDHPLVLIVDEAKTVKNPVFEAVDRCRVGNRAWTLTVVVSSAGYAGGEFHALNTSRRDSLTHPPVVQTSHDCPHIKPEEIAADEKKWGKDHPLVKSMHYSEFMGFMQGAIVQVKALDELLADPPPFEPGPRKGFCDFAWSEDAAGDESVLALRNGNEITIPLTFREKGLHATAARFVMMFNELASKIGLQAHEIEGDADGRGKEIIKVIRGMGWPIGEAHNGGKPRWNENYQNLAAETWCEGASAIIHRKYRLPLDNDLYAQMINRKIVPNNKGVLAIESKQAMKDPNRDGGSVPCSPDRADAVFGAMAPQPLNRSITVMGDEPQTSGAKSNLWERQTFEKKQGPREGEFVPGAWAG
jgi:phage terminase large subunit